MKSLLLFAIAQLLGVGVTWLALCALLGCLASLSRAVMAAKARRFAEAVAFSLPFLLIVGGVAACVVWLRA